jgi:voltage-gated potassium channel
MKLTRPRIPRRIRIAIEILLGILIIGTIGYRVIEGDEWSLFDALYMTAITLTTVGYGETHPLSTAGRIFTIILLFGGVFVVFFMMTEIIRSVVTGEYQQLFGKERMAERLSTLHDHTIICGMGRMGRNVSHEFTRQSIIHVAIDRVEANFVNSHQQWTIPVIGDATNDEILKQVGVERAKVLISVLPSDADNLYVTLSARLLNPKLIIVARAEEDTAESKLRKVGANHVVAPYVIGGLRVAQMVLRPNLGHFLEKALQVNVEEFRIDEFLLSPTSLLNGIPLSQSLIREDLGVVVLAIKTAEGKLVYNPPAETILQAGSVLIAVGDGNQLRLLRERLR